MLVAKQAIRAVGQISLQLSTRANTCVDKLLSLLIMDIDYVTSETLVAMTSEWHFSLGNGGTLYSAINGAPYHGVVGSF